MPSTATITAKTGPAVQVTALPLTDVKEFYMDLGPKSVLRIDDGVRGNVEFDLQPITTITITIAAGNATIVVS